MVLISRRKFITSQSPYPGSDEFGGSGISLRLNIFREPFTEEGSKGRGEREEEREMEKKVESNKKRGDHGE